jgi:hypothetical protein
MLRAVKKPSTSVILNRVEHVDGHQERGLELGGKPWHSAAHIVQATTSADDGLACVTLVNGSST